MKRGPLITALGTALGLGVVAGIAFWATRTAEQSESTAPNSPSGHSDVKSKESDAPRSVTPPGAPAGAAPVAGTNSTPGVTQNSGGASPTGGTPSANSAQTAAPPTPNNQAVSPSASAPAASAPAPAECRTLSFKHKVTDGHKDAESCSAHRNQIKLAIADLNPKSVCVRVDGTPVKFELNKSKDGKDWLVVIPPMAGPGSKITTRFGTGKLTCKEDCTIPKDEFLSALGADSEGTKAERAPAQAHTGKWKHKSKNQNAEVNADIESEVDRELGAGGDDALPTFADWIQE